MTEFSGRDRVLARSAQDQYAAQVYGSGGVGYAFESAVPGEVIGWLDRCGVYGNPETRGDKGRRHFNQNIGQVLGLAHSLKHFIDRPITAPNPLDDPGLDSPETLTHEITPEYVKNLNDFHRTLRGYSETVDQPGQKTVEIIAAVKAVSEFLHPEKWRDTGEDVPESIGSGVRSAEIETYLEKVILIASPRPQSEPEQQVLWDELRELNRY